jgi:hypothetical protein
MSSLFHPVSDFGGSDVWAHNQLCCQEREDETVEIETNSLFAWISERLGLGRLGESCDCQQGREEVIGLLQFPFEYKRIRSRGFILS